MIKILGPFLLTFATVGCGSTLGLSPIPSDTRQAIVVQVDSWEATTGVLYRASKVHGQWNIVGTSVPAQLGKNGLAWGVGLHEAYIQDDESSITTPYKHEGDGRSPAGVFNIGDAYGSAAELSQTSRWPYHTNPGDFVCIDDMTSEHYNSVQVKGSGEWSSSQPIAADDAPLTLAIRNNQEPVVPGKGSCTFLLSTTSKNGGTQGSTAIDESALNEIFEWLDPDMNPVLIQLPAQFAEGKRDAWGLPVGITAATP
jgi:L,D-peptidoglycan transpeptidase YkuD (ErfK/YbiS/YcfS/YnhG family)